MKIQFILQNNFVCFKKKGCIYYFVFILTISKMKDETYKLFH